MDSEYVEDASARARQLLRTCLVPQGDRNRNPPLKHHPCPTDSLEASTDLRWRQKPSTLWGHSDRSPDPLGKSWPPCRQKWRKSARTPRVCLSLWDSVAEEGGKGDAALCATGGCCRGGRAAGASPGHRLSRTCGLGSTAQARLLSNRNGAKPRILLPPGKQGCRTPRQQNARRGWDLPAFTTLPRLQGEAGQAQKGPGMPRA